MEQGRENPQDAAWAQRAPFRRETRRGAIERPRRALVAAVACAHVALLAIAMHVIRENRAPAPSRANEAIEIELLAPAPAPAIPSPRGRPVSDAATPKREPPRDAPPTGDAPSPPAPTPAPQLFDERGALRLPQPD